MEKYGKDITLHRVRNKVIIDSGKSIDQLSYSDRAMIYQELGQQLWKMLSDDDKATILAQAIEAAQQLGFKTKAQAESATVKMVENALRNLVIADYQPGKETLEAAMLRSYEGLCKSGMINPDDSPADTWKKTMRAHNKNMRQ